MQKQQQHPNVTELTHEIIRKTRDLELLSPMSGHYPVAHAELTDLIKKRDALIEEARGTNESR